MCLGEMLLCKDETRRQQRLHPLSLLLVPTPKSGLAKGLFPGDLHLLPSVWYQWRECSRPGILQSSRPARGRRSPCLSGGAAHHQPSSWTSAHQQQDALPGCSGLRTQTENLLQSPRPLVTPKSCLPLDTPGRCIFTPCWLHQVFCPLTKSLQRNQSILGLCSPLQSPGQGFHSPSVADCGELPEARLRGGKQHAAGCLLPAPWVAPACQGQNLVWAFL